MRFNLSSIWWSKKNPIWLLKLHTVWRCLWKYGETTYTASKTLAAFGYMCFHYGKFVFCNLARVNAQSNGLYSCAGPLVCDYRETSRLDVLEIVISSSAHSIKLRVSAAPAEGCATPELGNLYSFLFVPFCL